MFLVALLISATLLADGPSASAFDASMVQMVDHAMGVLFPPVRLSVHLCRVDQERAVSLSLAMSRRGLAHEIHLRLEDFEERVHDSWEHQVLYVLDLDCDYAIPLLRTANASGMFVAPIRWLLLATRPGDRAKQAFKDMAVYPDSDVTLASGANGSATITSLYRPSWVREVREEHRGNWTAELGVRLTNLYPASRRRRNLQRTPLKSAIVITDPDTINHLTDYENKHIDPVSKVNYPWVLHIANRMNATVSLVPTDTWGYRNKNGTWSGMIGLLYRREADIGCTGNFITQERIGAVDYVQLYTYTYVRFVFRKPLLSTVSNIFALPFQRSVWLAVGVFLALVLGMLYFSAKWEFRRGQSASSSLYWQQFHPAEQTLSDNFMVVLGAIAQQGYSYEPYRVPPRIVTLMLLIVVLNLYVSYTANIVALLQSTTDSIQTPADLLHSPLKLGAQDTVYNRHYFKNFRDPVRRAMVDQKIEPKGRNDSSTWMTMEEGVRRLKTELFAFHGETGSLYEIMQKTFLEEEKCGIMEVDILNMRYPLMAIQARSPYLEIIRNTALLLRETGLRYREDNRLYATKPTCHGRTTFVRIGFTECYFAIAAMCYGTLLSLLVLTAEFTWRRNGESIERAVLTFVGSFRARPISSVSSQEEMIDE